MPRNRINVISKLTSTVAFIDKMIKAEMRTFPPFEVSTDDPLSLLGDYLHTEYVLNDMMFPAFWWTLSHIRDCSDDEQTAEKLRFTGMVQFFREFNGEKDYVVNGFLEEKKFALPIISSYFLIYYIWSCEIIAFFETEGWNKIDLDADESGAEVEEKPDHETKIQALLFAVQELESGLAWELEAMSPHLATCCEKRRQVVSDDYRRFLQKDAAEKVAMRNCEEDSLNFDLSFVKAHRKSCPIASAYLYISDILVHELRVSSP